VTILDLMDDERLLGKWFRGDTWHAWRVFLAVLFGLHDRIDAAGLAMYRAATGRAELPSVQIKQAWPDVGRRGGKSIISALVAVFLAFFRDYTPYFSPGEIATVMIVAADHKQARVVMRFIRAFIVHVPMFEKLVTRTTRESIELANHVVMEVHTASYRSTRGYTLAAVINDEIAFWPTDDSAEPDREVLAAQSPAMATIPNSLMLCPSSPHGFKGCQADAYKANWGKDTSILFWKAPSRALPGAGYAVEMNPGIDLSIVRADYEQDHTAAASNWGAEFRTDIESLITKAAVDAATFRARLELAPVEGVAYFAFCDPSGGSSDSMTLGIAHLDAQKKAVLDCLRERRPPFSPDDVVKEFANTLKPYRLFRVTGDRYSGAWCAERFRVQGIEYVASEKTKSELYLELVPLLNAGRCELLDNPRLLAQLCALERRVARGGRDSVDHGPGAHDDLANAAAGALVLAPQVQNKPWLEVLRVGTPSERGWAKIN
jgi:hypothetical protein